MTTDTEQEVTTPPVARPANGVAARQGAGAGWGLPLLVLIIGSFMSILDTSIVNVAILTIQNEFGATTESGSRTRPIPGPAQRS